MSVSTNDLRNGISLHLPEGLMTVVEFQHVKPGKGGAFVRTKLKNYRTGAVLERTFRADEKLRLAVIDKREMQYLYRDGDDYVFMGRVRATSRSTFPPPSSGSGEPSSRGDTLVLPTYQDQVVGVDLPAAVELKVTGTEPGMQGDRVSGRKAATLETGLVVQVPLFVEVGDTLKVDTRSGEYPTRA